MKKYKVYYDLGDQLGIGEDWQQQISAETPEQAYREFVKQVGAFPRAVNVEKGFLGDIDVFDDHVAKIETERETVDSKESFNVQISEITEKQGLDKPESSTEKLLIKIMDFQQKQLELNVSQFDELQKINLKLMMFWIILVVLPLLGLLLIQ